MPGWLIILIIAVMLAGSVVIVWVTRTEERRREARKQRFELNDQSVRLPMAEPRNPRQANAGAVEEAAAFLARDQSATFRPDPRGGIDPDPAGPVITDPLAGGESRLLGRVVETEDGESIITTPPFRLRESVFSKRHGRFATALIRRLPPWLVIAPRVRLDALVTPTSPDGRDADDWRTWRKRVRLRCVDLVLCDRRTWKPILAIIFERENVGPRASLIGGGQDRIIDEVLASIGLPYVRITGHLREDWHAIRPYVEQAMLPTVGDAEETDDDRLGGTGWDASAAVTLLKLDDEKGWSLE